MACCIDPSTGVTTAWPAYKPVLAPANADAFAFAVILGLCVLAALLVVAWFWRRDAILEDVKHGRDPGGGVVLRPVAPASSGEGQPQGGRSV